MKVYRLIKQDVYLTGNPQITFFKVVYRRYTNFAMECIEQTLTGNPDFGRKTNALIIRNGDLAYRMYLMVTLNTVRWNDPKNRCKFAWIRRLGHALIKNVDVEIGGSRIDRQYGTWLDLWYELTHDINQERGYRAMIGDVEELTRLDGPDGNGHCKDHYTMYIPMQFWFNRNSGLALPLIALQYHEVRLLFEFEDVNRLIVWQPHIDEFGKIWCPDFKGLCMKDASILVDYVYLDSVERRRFAQVGHEYLIEQVQFTGDETLTGNSNASNLNYKSKLGFNHPTKELIWVIKNSTFAGDDRSAGGAGNGHAFLAYTNETHKWETVALQDAANNLATGMLKIVHTSHASEGSPTNPAHETSSIKLDLPATAVDITTRHCPPSHNIRFNIFTLCPNNNTSLEFQKYPIYSGQVTEKGASIFNFADYIDEVQVNVDLTGHGTGFFTATVVSHHLSLNDVSIPLDWGVSPNNLIDNRFNSCNDVNPNDVYVIQHNNYGLRLDGKGNPVADAGLQFNGQDRFDPRYGSYFNYVQPYQHHTRTPADGVNVYSFALHPEQHQPTGTANLSRIDSSMLILRCVDHLRNASGIKPRLSIDLSNSKLFTFGFNYNVLRIMSGMGGFWKAYYLFNMLKRSEKLQTMIIRALIVENLFVLSIRLFY